MGRQPLRDNDPVFHYALSIGYTMAIEIISKISLNLAAFLCSLVAGFLFSFAVVVMPGISNLNNREFIRAFQEIDRVIQNNQPIFMVVWLGSVVALVISSVLGIWQLNGAMRLLIIFAALSYLFGVQLPTATINIPLNNKLQSLVVDTMDDKTQETARYSGFEKNSR